MQLHDNSDNLQKNTKYSVHHKREQLYKLRGVYKKTP